MERQTEIFYLLAHYQYGHKSQGWASPKPKARSLSWVSHVGAGAQPFGPLLRHISKEMD